MKTQLTLASIALTVCASAQTIFNFDNGPVNTGTPFDQISDGITAHFSAEGAGAGNPGYAIWASNVFGFTPPGFAGNSLWPASINRTDLYISFSTPGTSISMLYAPQELNTSSSCTMKLSAYMGATLIGYTLFQSQNEGNWPSDTLSFSSAQQFDNVVVHYQSPPPTGGDYGVIFAVDNVNYSPVPEPASLALLGLGVLALLKRRAK